MANSESTDGELLADWLSARRERSFRLLVERHAGMVHAAARRVAGDDGAAAEVSQAVFILLARRAALLCSRPSLAGWLHITAVMQARNLMRKNLRESKKRQQLLAEMKTTPSQEGGDGWQELRPVIDEAIASLPEKDRETVLLHFYHALSVPEIASRLGIATDAARKRLERATARLRAVLGRKGYHAGIAFPVVLSQGLVGDLSAVNPKISFLVSKAFSTAPLHPVLPILVMKASSILPPAAAAVIAAILLLEQRNAVASLERKILKMEAVLTTRGNSAMPISTNRPGARGRMGQAGGKGTIDWREVAKGLEETLRSGFSDDLEMTKVRRYLSGLSSQELLQALDDLKELDIPWDTKEALAQEVVRGLMEEDPELALERLVGTQTLGTEHLLTIALRNLAAKDPAKAVEWLDRQIAAGRFESGYLDEQGRWPIEYEAELGSSTFLTHPGIIRKRLLNLPVGDRRDILSRFVIMSSGEREQRAFLELVRDTLPAGERASAIAAQASKEKSLAEVSRYFDRAEVSAAERESMVGQVTNAHLTNYFFHRRLTMEDMDEVGSWASSEAPGAADEILGNALAKVSSLRGGRTNYPELVELLVALNQKSPSDIRLVRFLSGEGSLRNKDQAASLAGLISDEGLRQQILGSLGK
ncbi:MAG: sigma-70 family RNA polymerase sigma factor [Akkermansiaceae bacterium]|nr:sigma-70 family RNA polymerase sigma factor [Akkermansiaceae bacterium]